MQRLKRWAPLVGGGILAASVILRVFHLNTAADFVEQIGGITGLGNQSPIGVSELAGAVAMIAGMVLKIRAEIQRARAADFVTPPAVK